MLGYVKSISKRSEGDDKEKTLPIANLGGSMVAHGEDFDAHSEYGRCMTSTLLRTPLYCRFGDLIASWNSVRENRGTVGACTGGLHIPGNLDLS